MKHLLFILLSLFSTIALASSNQDHTCQGGHNCNTYETGGGNHNEQDQTQGQVQGQTQSAEANANAVSLSSASVSSENTNVNLNDNVNTATGGSAYASGGAGGEGGSAIQGQSQYSDNSNSSNNSSSQNVTFEGSGEASHYNKYGNNVSAYAPAIYSSSACTAGGVSGGVSGLGFGVALGGAKQDPQCQIRENARILSGLDTNLAIEYLCKNPGIDVGAVLGAACKSTPIEIAPPIVIPDPEPEIPVQVITEPVKG